MASKTYYAYANGGSQTHYRGKVVLTETNDTANNKSRIDYAFYLYRADGYTGAAHNFSNGNKLVVTINGMTLISSANYKAVRLTGTSESNPLLMCSGSIDVAHNSDGTKSFAFSFAYDQTQNTGQELDYLTVAGTHTCTTIARSSGITLSKSSTDFGTAVTITVSSASSSFTHNLRYAFGTKSGTIASNAGTNTSWTIPVGLMSEIPNAASGTIQVICETRSGSTLIGTKQVNLTATVPSGIVPSLSVSVSEAASMPSGITEYVQGRSRLKVTSTASGQYGASIKSYKTTVEGADYSGSTVTTNTVSGSGTVAVKVTVTDSRGRTTTKTVNVTVAAYSAPRLTGVTAYRCASATSTAADSDGAYICVKPGGSITALGNKNSKTCTVYYKKTSAEYYSNKALTMNDYTLDTEYVIFAADTASGYNVYVELRDSFSSVRSFAADAMSAGAFVDALLNDTETEIVGMGVGKVAEKAGFVDVGWETELRKSMTVHDIAKLQKGFYVFSSGAGGGSQGYICMARITITGPYPDAPIELTIAHRRCAMSRITVLFANSSGTDPALAHFWYTGGDAGKGAVLVKSATGTWDLYIRKSEARDWIAITDVKMDWGYAQEKIAITYPGTFSASVSGTTAEFYNPASTADYATTAASATNATNATRATTAGIAEALKKAIDISVANLEVTDGVEIHHATPYIDFHFARSTADHTARIIEGTKGILTAFNGITSASDKRLKKDIHDIPDEYYQLIEKLYPKLYRFTKADTYLDAGLIAQDVLKTERELGITKSILVRGTGRQIPDPKDPAKTIIDYFSIDYQSYSVLQGAYFMRKINALEQRIGQIEEKLSCAGANREEQQ